MNDVHKHYIWAVAGLLALAIIAGAYLKSRDDVTRAEQVKQDVQNQISDLRRDLAANLQKIEQERESVKTPEQVVRVIPQYVQLPSPAIVKAEPSAAEGSSLKAERMNAGNSSNLPDSPSAAKGIYFPPEDVKPLFDSLADGKACGLKLDACQKESELLTQRAKAAENAMHGGSFWSKLKSNSKWFVIGGLVGGGVVLGAKR